MATKSLNDRVEKALDAVTDARDALESARDQDEDLGKAVRQMRKLLVSLGEIVEDATDTLATIESELEARQALKLGSHVSPLDTAADTLEELSQLELDE